VEYRLTELGRGFRPIGLALPDWSDSYQAARVTSESAAD
jgi:DNA-binding HxlR family transcriptional regulator